LGLALTSAGTTTSVVSYFIAHVIPLTALGVAAIIVGLTAASLPDQVTGSYAMKALLRGSTLGIDPLLDEIRTRTGTAKPGPETPNPAWKYPLQDLESEQRRTQVSVFRAIYLPPKYYGVNSGNKSASEDERASVYIPLSNVIPTTMDEMRLAPTLLLPEGAEQEGIRVFTAGAYLGQVAEIGNEDTTIEDALHYILVESAELCSSVRASEIEETIVVELDNVKVEPESESYRDLLGSLPTSLAASAVATARAAPVVIADEDIAPTRTIARLLILHAK
jgi:hypothetical protein